MAKPTPAQLGRRARQKGKSFQKQVAELIAAHINLPLEDVHSCVGGKTEADVHLSAEARRRFPFYTECKNYKKWGASQLREWTQQAMRDCPAGLAACCIVKFHGDGTPYVVIDLATFLRWVA